MTGKHGRIARGSVALLLAISTSLTLSNLSSAAPSRQDLEEAKARLAALNEHLSLVVEQFNQARIRLEEVQARLAETRRAAQQSAVTAARARADLNARAAAAYQGVGFELSILLGASSFTEFSDRVEFIGQIAQSDAELATRAEIAHQEARWTAEELAEAVAERQAVLESIREKETEIRDGVADAEALVAKIGKDLREAAAERRSAAAADAASFSSVGITPQPVLNPPPAPNPNAQAAIDAAYSVIGTPYQYGGSSPETGFDCSGFTMWSWAHAGVSLPHSSAIQYATLPHVSQSDLVPGDLLFFYSPIHHVGMYVGGGSMIHSPQTGDVVSVVPVYWQYFVGAARPG